MTTRLRLIRPAGFTLVEILLVLVIVSIIIGLTLVAAAKLRDSASVSRTRAMLGSLETLAGQYETSTQMPIGHLDGSVRFAWSDPKTVNNPDHMKGSVPERVITGDLAPNEETGDDDEDDAKRAANLFSERFVWVLNRMPGMDSRLRGLGEDVFVDKDDDGFMEVRDPWGHCIAYAGPSTERGTASEDDFLPSRRAPFLASAGPDGLWGVTAIRADFSSDSAYSDYLKSDEGQWSRDNIFSFDFDQSAQEVRK